MGGHFYGLIPNCFNRLSTPTSNTNHPTEDTPLKALSFSQKITDIFQLFSQPNRKGGKKEDEEEESDLKNAADEVSIWQEIEELPAS